MLPRLLLLVVTALAWDRPQHRREHRPSSLRHPYQTSFSPLSPRQGRAHAHALPPRQAHATRPLLRRSGTALGAAEGFPRGLRHSARAPQPLGRQHRTLHQVAPGHQRRVSRPHVQGRIIYNRQRPSRKISSTPLKLGKNRLNSKKPAEKTIVKRDKLRLAEKDDNLAVESTLVETKVKPARKPVVKAAPQKVQEAAKAPVERATYAAPAPKFIIKQAGPSQTYGWVGHGSYAPLNIQNIFKAAGINTRWIPDENGIFEAGLTYPKPAPKKKAKSYPPPSNKVKKAISLANYNSPSAPAALPPKYAPASPKHQPSAPAKAPYKKPAYKKAPSKPAYEAPAPAPAYQPPTKTSYKTPAKPAYEAPALAPSYQAPSKPSYEAPAPAPAYQAPIKPAYEAPAPPPAYKPLSFPTFNSQLADSFSSGSQDSYKTAKATTTPRPVYRAPSTTTSATTTTATTTAPATTTSSPYTYKVSAVTSPSAPIRASPTPYNYGSPTPTPYSYTPPPRPAYYQPSPSYQPSKPFTSFKEVKSASPVAAVIETEATGPEDDGEVFYIFYENEENKQVEAGRDIKRFIHEEIGLGDNSAAYSTSVPQGDIFADQNAVPTFSIVEEAGGQQEPIQPVYYDIPIKVEESGEGFDPPTEIRTIFVPIENAINIPDTFDINLGTSFGYNKNKKSASPATRFSNFPSYGATASSYDSPISSYDAPIAPSQGTVSKASPVEAATRPVVRKARRPSVLKAGYAYQPSAGTSSIPFGTRLGPRDQYDPLTLRR